MSEFSAWMPLVQLVFGVVIGWIGWSVRAIKRCIEKDLAKVKMEFEIRESALAARLARVEVACETKADREDSIREAARTRITLERLIEGQARLEGKLDAGARIAAAIEGLREGHGNGIG